MRWSWRPPPTRRRAGLPAWRARPRPHQPVLPSGRTPKLRSGAPASLDRWKPWKTAARTAAGRGRPGAGRTSRVGALPGRYAASVLWPAHRSACPWRPPPPVPPPMRAGPDPSHRRPRRQLYPDHQPHDRPPHPDRHHPPSHRPLPPRHPLTLGHPRPRHRAEPHFNGGAAPSRASISGHTATPDFHRATASGHAIACGGVTSSGHRAFPPANRDVSRETFVRLAPASVLDAPGGDC